MSRGAQDIRQFERLNDLFARACDLSDDERRALLDRECADDPSLRERLEAMLHQDRASGTRLESPLAGPEAGDMIRRLAEAEDAALPAQLGRYRLLRKLASGGMGTVYEAEQDSPKRTVAVKVIRSGLVSPQMLSRFRHEGEILGTLHHPGVAQVYDSGAAEVVTSAGVVKTPFIAMELVSGRDLMDYVRQTDLPTAERLALFVRICDAVQHAHHKGVIHRDLKPANILVEDGGQPKILDFGVARLHSAGHAATLQTTAGQIVGTLAYMSPEQIAGDPGQVDSRSDVYSLGVILYELLTGELPLRIGTTSIAEAARVIRDDDPPALASMSSQFRGDLDTIAGKALHKRREDRYQSAAELGGDVSRFLSHQPILARPASTSYILRKFARRHRALVAGVAAAASALLIGSIATTIFAIKAVANERAMRREAVLSAESARFMKDMLSGVRPAVAAGRDRTMLRDILNQTAARLDKGELSQHPRVEADIRSTIGAAYKDIGDLDRTSEMLEGALKALDRAAAPQPILLATVHDQLGAVLQDQGRLSDADVYYTRAKEVLSNTTGPQPDVDDLVHLIDSHVSGLRREQGQLGEAERLQREVLAWAVERYGPRDPKVATHLHNLGGLLSDLQKFPDAEKYYRESLDILRAAHGETHPSIAVVCENLGNVMMWQNKFDDADEFLTDAVRIHIALQSENTILVSRAKGNLGDLRLRQGRSAEAVDLYRSALAGFERSLKPDHLYVGFTKITLAQAMAAGGDFAGAETVMLEGYNALASNPDIPASDNFHNGAHVLALYENWNTAAPSEKLAAKVAEWRTKLGK